jgi:hypothetical protein
MMMRPRSARLPSLGGNAGKQKTIVREYPVFDLHMTGRVGGRECLEGSINGIRSRVAPEARFGGPLTKILSVVRSNRRRTW